jgi:hypothetical protein
MSTIPSIPAPRNRPIPSIPVEAGRPVTSANQLRRLPNRPADEGRMGFTLPNEPADARLTGGTRSLDRRLLALNLSRMRSLGADAA